MKKTYFLLPLILLLGIIQSCSITHNLENEEKYESHVVATIQNRPITYEELKRGFTGSLDSDSIIVDDLRDFLPSYVDYRLKIIEGRRLGYFDDPDVESEYKTFAKEAAEKQWMNNEVKTRILDAFIERSQKELLAYHILITAKNPDHVESREIKRQLNEARNEILEGVDPDSVNIKYSSMQNGNYAGGPLPWITAGRTVRSFEDAVYSLEPGEVSLPFQSQFGFHIIYLMHERPRTPERFTRHIFVSKQGDENPDQKITEALDSLRNGVSWSEVVDEFSDDRRTAARSGEIGWVGYGMQFPESFVDEVTNASAKEEFSDIIEMDYGFHIIKVDSVRNLSDQETMQQYALDELERLGLLQPGKNELYELLKEHGKFQIYDEEFERVADFLLGYAENIELSTPIAIFNEKTILANQFVEFYEQEIGHSSDESVSIGSAFELFTNRMIEANLIELTKNRFDNYKFEMEQFLNGLVVFKVNEEFLWNPEAADEQLLRNHFEQNRSDYVTNRTITYYRITATSDSAITSAKRNLLDHKNPEIIEDNIDNIIVRSGSVSNQSSELFQQLNKMAVKEASEIENNETWHQFYYIADIEPQRAKTFDEAKTEVFNEVREQHERNYLQWLRNKYETDLYPQNVQ